MELLARSRALDRAGIRIPARMAMMAITTSNSINVKECAADSGYFLWAGVEGILISKCLIFLSKKSKVLFLK